MYEQSRAELERILKKAKEEAAVVSSSGENTVMNSTHPVVGENCDSNSNHAISHSQTFIDELQSKLNEFDETKPKEDVQDTEDIVRKTTKFKTTFISLTFTLSV